MPKGRERNNVDSQQERHLRRADGSQLLEVGTFLGCVAGMRRVKDEKCGGSRVPDQTAPALTGKGLCLLQDSGGAWRARVVGAIVHLTQDYFGCSTEKKMDTVLVK